MILLVTVGPYLLLLIAGALFLRAILGVDPDLEAPWDPAAPPDYTKRALCGERSCRVDHETVGRWRERAAR